MRKCEKCDKTYDDTWKVCLLCQSPLTKEDILTKQKDDASVLKGKTRIIGYILIGIGGLWLIFSFIYAVALGGFGFNFITMEFMPYFKFHIYSLLRIMLMFAAFNPIGLIIFYIGKRMLPKNIWYEIIFWSLFPMTILSLCFIIISLLPMGMSDYFITAKYNYAPLNAPSVYARPQVFSLAAVKYFNNGNISYEQGNLTQAIADFNKAIEIDPMFAEAYCNRGNAYAKQGNLPQAISDFNKAIEINPRDAMAYDNRGDAYRKQGNFIQAISDCSKAIEINPNLANAYNNRGIIYKNQGNFTQAIADYTKAIEINPNGVLAYYNRGNAYYKQGNFTQAISDFNKATEINPNLAALYEGRAYAYFDKKEYEKTWVDVHKAESLGYKADKEDLEFLEKLKKASGRDK